MAVTQIAHSKINPYEFFFSNKTRKTYTNLAICIVLILVLLIFALRPTILTIQKIREKTKEYQRINGLLKTKIDHLRNLQREAFQGETRGLKDQIAFMDKVFSYKTSLVSLIYNIQKRATDNNIAIRNFTSQIIDENNPSLKTDSFDNSSASPSSKYCYLVFTVQSQNMQTLNTFIKSLEGYENFPFFSRIQNISIADNKYFVSNFSSDNSLTDMTKIDSGIETVDATINLVIYLDQSRIE